MMKPHFKNLILIILLLPGHLVTAQTFQRDSIKEQKIELQLQSIDVSVLTTFKQGTIAMDQGNLALADSLYAAVLTMAPSFDPVLRRLGSIRAQSGNLQEGIELCAKAVEINRSAYNLLSLAICYHHYEGYEDLDIAMGLLSEARSLPDGNDVDIIALYGQIQLEKDNVDGFRNTIQTLQQSYPNEMYTHYYSAILNAYDRKWSDANNEILTAQKLGLSDEAVQGFLDSGVRKNIARKSFAIGFLWVVVAWLAGLLLLFTIGKLLSSITLKSIEKDSLSDGNNRKGHSLRSFYKSLMNAGGVYYYISLPIVVLLVIALVTALIYLFLMAGTIPVKLLLFLIIGACISIYAMIRSLFVKVSSADPGRELKREEAPKLYDLTAEVAKTLNTRSVDEIRITQGTDLAVYERGTWKEKLGDKAQRILILGVGVLKDFRKNDFKAVLAHEYGHFAHRDTAGGEVALRVMNDMTKYFYALYQSGQTVWWNLAFQFLRVYHFIFRRISHGSTRLQEVLADRVAVQTYGQLAFQNGLTHVIKRDIEFIYLTNKEIEAVNLAKRPFNNLYELKVSSDGVVETELEKALNLATTEDDTHPSPTDRFRYTARIPSPANESDLSMITDLFKDWNSLTQEMTQLIAEKVNQDSASS